MTYFEEVEFLTEVAPNLIERNSEEFKRIHKLLESTLPTVKRVKQDTDWQGSGREKYDSRLDDAGGLVENLSKGFIKASEALANYAPEADKARKLVEEGQVSEQKLSDEIEKVATAITRTAQKAEPMRQWEDIRATTGVFDWLAELGMDVDSIREKAERFYRQTDEKFTQAKDTEKSARDACLEGMDSAYRALPDFRTNSKESAAIISGIETIAQEASEAAGNANVSLSGSGPKTGLNDISPETEVSPKLQRFRDIAANLPEGTNTPYWLSESSNEFRQDWIQQNKATIEAAAKQSGLPTDLVAGIAWQEVGGKGRVFDDMTQTARDFADSGWSPVTPENLPDRLAGDPDETSYGALSIQVRRAAEVLGYDPENLTEAQREEVIAASENPKTNIMISAEHLANLKARSEFADVPAGEMTSEQYAELGARYNGGPNWNENANAQAYGETLLDHLPEARKAMQ
ncbi:hypothetical protein ACOQFL_17235 [Actinopolyspora sp. H202]|uniref:hypothetical protein n=1 Tax=Actinopolyspora sp. H202 TaxID=1500456 RepID=UPI003EE42A02